jgi:hypothetical protein
MAEKEESAQSTFKSAESGMSFEPQLKGNSEQPTKLRIVKMAEKEEPAQSTFKSAESGMSFEPQLEGNSEQPTKLRIVKMAEKEEPAQSTFQSAASGISFEPLQSSVSNTTEPKLVVASSSGLFQRGTKKAPFGSDGSQYVDQSPKEKRLFLAQKVAAEMITAKEKASATFETDETGMNMVVTNKRRKKASATTSTTSVPPLNAGEGRGFESQPRVLPRNRDSGGMKMVSFVANEFSKQSASTFDSIKQSKLDLNSAKKTAADVQKFAKFVSDGLQIVYEDSQKKRGVVTPKEAMRQKKERERKKILGFEIGPSEEELASQMMEGGKQFAKFASDGLQMVYRAAEKQTKEYIAPNESATAKKESQPTSDRKPRDSSIEPQHTSTPFFAASDATSKTNEKKESVLSTSATNSPKPFFAASDEDEELVTKASIPIDSPKDIGNGSPHPFFAVTREDPSGNELHTEVARPAKDESPPLSTSSLVRNGGRIFANFIGDGIQMVQRVAKLKEKRYHRQSK